MTMKITIRSFAIALTLAVLSQAAAARAQHPAGTPHTSPSLELTYDYVRTNGPPGHCSCINLNGGGAAVVFPLPHPQWAVVGSIAVTRGGNIGAIGYDLTLFTYTGGIRYLPRLHRQSAFQPYAELQIGGVQAGGSLANTPSLAGQGIGASFAATAGGGVNLDLHKRFAFKLIDAEYMTTNYANGSTDHQNDLRIGAGIVVPLGRR